jgi:polyisoprenyl-teichoic acid--peptidoglycan teichoic acid transferase
MSFIRKIKKDEAVPMKHKTMTRKKKIWRGVVLFFVVFLVVIVSYSAYLISTGSKMFENGLSGQSLIKSLYGKEDLKGENEDRINILLMGMGGSGHPGGLLTDSIMVLSIRPSDKKVAILSIPRDLYVKIEGHGSDKINSAYSDGYTDYYDKNCKKKATSACIDSAMTAGANLSASTVSNILNLPIQYYASADFSGFEKIIDLLGGVDVYVDKAIYDPYFPDDAMKGYSPFKISAGQHHLDGKTALKYARSRETTSDFDRAARQQKILSAAKDKAMTLGILSNPVKIADLVSTLGSSIKTNFTLSELKAFVQMMGDVKSGNIVTEVLSNGPDGLLTDFNNGTYYLKPKSGNFDQIQYLAKTIFNYEPKESATIEVQNGTSTTGLASKLAKQLQEDGYVITAIATAKQKSAKTIIYDYSSGSKKSTLVYLKNKLNAEVVTSTKEAGTSADIRVIIGENYKATN